MLEDKAKEVGRLIGQSPEYQGVKRATDALNNDREATTLLRQIEQLRTEATRMLERDEQPTAAMEQQLDELLSKVQVLPAYQQAAVAQENFDKIMVKVNNWILDGMKKGATSSIITL